MKRFVVFIVANAFTQVVGVAAGFIALHAMTYSQYAIFSVANVTMGSISILTKSGVHLGFASILGKVWPDKNKISVAHASMKKTRKLLSFIFLPVIFVVTGFILYSIKASFFDIIATLFLMSAYWIFDIYSRVTDLVLSFDDKNERVQILDSAISAIRLLGSLIVTSVGLKSAIFYNGLIVAAAGLRVPFISRWTSKYLKGPEVVSYEYLKSIKYIVYRQVPNDIYFIIQGQFAIFALSFSHSNVQVASFGALSRLSLLFQPVLALLAAYAVPAFSKMIVGQVRFLLMLVASLTVVWVSAVLLAHACPDIFVFILGKRYIGVKPMLVLAMFSSGFQMVVGAMWGVIAHKGYNRFTWIQIPLGLIWYCCFPFFVNISNLQGVIWLQVGITAIYGFAVLIEALVAFKRNKLEVGSS